MTDLPAEYVALRDWLTYGPDMHSGHEYQEKRAALDSFVAGLVELAYSGAGTDSAIPYRDMVCGYVADLAASRSENEILRSQSETCRAELRDEQERHAQLQARCYDQGGGSVFDEVRVRGKERDAALASQERLRGALRKCVSALRAPIDDWKGEQERIALDAANAALASEGGEK